MFSWIRWFLQLLWLNSYMYQLIKFLTFLCSLELTLLFPVKCHSLLLGGFLTLGLRSASFTTSHGTKSCFNFNLHMSHPLNWSNHSYFTWQRPSMQMTISSIMAPLHPLFWGPFISLFLLKYVCDTASSILSFNRKTEHLKLASENGVRTNKAIH